MASCHARQGEESDVRVVRVVPGGEDRGGIVGVALVSMGKRVHAGRSIVAEQVGETTIIGPALVHHLDRSLARSQTDRRDEGRGAHGAGEGVRPTAGPADDRTWRQAEQVVELREVVGPGQEGKVRMGVGAAVTRTIDGDEPDAGGDGGVFVWAQEPRTRPAMEQHHRPPGRVAPLGPGERPAVAERDRAVGPRNGRGSGHRGYPLATRPREGASTTRARVP